MLELPGFVDLQVNGYAGVDFLNPATSVADILRVAAALRRAGTAGFLLTVCTHRRDVIETNIAHAREALERQGAEGNILGIHLEGPFISPEYGYRGAHAAEYIIPPDLDWFRRLQEIAHGAIRMVTVAPEQPGALPFIRAVAPDLLVSAGHANPDYDTLRRAIDAGLRAVTHFGNGCRPEMNRHDNILIRILACPELNLCFIPDGHHLPQPFLRMLLNAVPVDRLVATSDMVMYGGMQPGVYERDTLRVRLHEDGRLCLADDEKLLYGSSSTMLQCMNHLAGLRRLRPAELREVGIANPLRLLGMAVPAFLKRPAHVRWEEAEGRFTSTP